MNEKKKVLYLRINPRIAEILEKMSVKYGEPKTSLAEKALVIGLQYLIDFFENSLKLVSFEEEEVNV